MFWKNNHIYGRQVTNNDYPTPNNLSGDKKGSTLQEARPESMECDHLSTIPLVPVPIEANPTIASVDDGH